MQLLGASNPAQASYIANLSDPFQMGRVIRNIMRDAGDITALKVLLVRDEHLILMDVEAALAEAGFDVVSAVSAAAGIAVFAEHGADICAVVTDIKLGKGASVWDVGRRVRKEVPAMPVIYMSGDSSGEWASQGVPNSVMIAKPFVFPQLITAISTLLNKSE